MTLYDDVVAHLDVRQHMGDELICLCPYHDDHNPSFAFNTVKGLFICYSCGVKGNAKQLADYLGTGLREQRTDLQARLNTVDKLIADYQKTLNEQPLVLEPSMLDRFDIPTTYWASRSLSPEVVSRFRLGYDIMEDAATLPIHNHRGELLGVIRRNLSKEPKYKFPSGVKMNSILFGWWEWKRDHGDTNTLCITEGQINAIALQDINMAAVALNGTNLSPKQTDIIRTIYPKEIIWCLDPDEAGQTATKKHVLHIKSEFPTIMQSTAYYRTSDKDWAEMDHLERAEAIADRKFIGEF